MKIVFLTTQSSIQSTVVGRIFPLAKEFKNMGHEVVVFLHSENKASSRAETRDPRVDSGSQAEMTRIKITGSNPFERTAEGKKRLSGFGLLWTIKLNALRAARGLIAERPDYVILVKPLPENTLAICIAKLFLWNTKVILDVDDFELFANKLSSLTQRTAIHLSERVATAIASHIVVATPFLHDHVHQLVAGKKEITLIPTGLNVQQERIAASGSHTLLYIGSVSLASGHRVDILPQILYEVRKEIPDASLLIAGSGDDEHELKKRFQELHIEHAVQFLGRFSVERVPEVASQAAILIDPIDASIVSRAKSSFRCALALVSAIPIVTSNIGIRTELIPESLHQKFFAKPEDVASYAARIIELFHSPLSESEKTMMRERSRKYTWEHLASSYNKLIL